MVVIATPVPGITPMPPIDVTTAARVKSALGDGHGTLTGVTDLDTLIDNMIKSVSITFEKYMNRQITLTTYTQYFDVDPGDTVFYPKAWPITAVSEVNNDFDRTFTPGGSTVVPATDYTFDGDDGVITIDRFTLVPGMRTLKIDYTGGMQTTAANFITDFGDIAEAADWQIVFMLRRRVNLGTFSASTGGGSVSFSDVELLPEVKRRLDLYRRKAFR